MNNKLCYLNDLNFNEKQRVNDLCTAGFKRDPSYDMIGSMNNPIVSLVLLNNLIVGVAFANEESYEVMHPLSKKYCIFTQLLLMKIIEGKDIVVY